MDKKGIIRKGNCTWKAALALGWTEIWINRADDLDGAEATAYAIADNRSGELSRWDTEALTEQVASLLNEENLNIRPEDLGFTDEELNGLLGQLEGDVSPSQLNGGDLPPLETHETVEHLGPPGVVGGGREEVLVSQGEVEAEEEDGTPRYEYKGIYALSEDAVFPTENEWGIPELRPDMLSEQIPTITHWHGECKEPEKTLFIEAATYFEARALNTKGSVLGFYVDDYRFEKIWNDAVKYVERFKRDGWGSLIAPDFSIWQYDPPVVQLFAIYKSRWVARYWQEAGFKIIPNISWVSGKVCDMCYLGIPKDSPVVSVQCRTTKSKKGHEYFLNAIAKNIEAINPKNVLVYGGTQHKDWLDKGLPKGPIYHYLESWTKARTRITKERNEAHRKEIGVPSS